MASHTEERWDCSYGSWGWPDSFYGPEWLTPHELMKKILDQYGVDADHAYYSYKFHYQDRNAFNEKGQRYGRLEISW